MHQLKGANGIVLNKQSQLIYQLFDEHLDIKRRQTADTKLLINKIFRMQWRKKWDNFWGPGVTKNWLYKVIVWGINEGSFSKGNFIHWLQYFMKHFLLSQK